MTTIESDGRRVVLAGRAAALARWLMDNHQQIERPSKAGIEAHFAGSSMVVKLHQTDELTVIAAKTLAA